MDYYEQENISERLMLAYYLTGQVAQDMNNALKAQEYYLKALNADTNISGGDKLSALINSKLGILYLFPNANCIFS